ncbi:MAG: ABC transporter permease [Chloroflexi bacterium]|nr:ABC transporter permease [Chloroflexota bacterium]
MTDITTSSASTPISRNPLKRLSVGTLQIGGLLLAIIIFAIVMQINFPVFLTPPNVAIMIVNFLPEAIIALGMTIVIITGGIDLSVAGVYPFAAIIVGNLLLADLPIPLAIVITLAVAASVGGINAFVANTFRVHPFIATLAMLLILRGLNIVITGGSPISGFPDAFSFLGRDGIELEGFRLRYSVFIWLGLAIAIGFALGNHRFWRLSYFIGGNRRSARMSGVNVERYLYFVYMLSAMLAGVAGIIVASQFNAASNSYGQNLELRVITAVVIGGASLNGGAGSILGSMLGVLFIAMIYNAFAMSGISTYWQDVVIGVMLLASIFLGEILKRWRTS